MIKNSDFTIRSILILCLCVCFLGAENKVVEKTEPSVQPQKEASLDWRIFGGVGFGGVFGVTDVLSGTLFDNFNFKKKQHYDRIFFEVDLGTEFVFNNGNGFNVLLDMDNQAFAIGANYVYELRGKYKYAFMSGFDIGKQYITPTIYSYYPLSGFHTTAPLIRYNLGVRYRAKKQALGINIKIPIYNTTLNKDNQDGFDKNYAGVALSISYSYFFKL